MGDDPRWLLALVAIYRSRHRLAFYTGGGWVGINAEFFGDHLTDLTTMPSLESEQERVKRIAAIFLDTLSK